MKRDKKKEPAGETRLPDEAPDIQIRACGPPKCINGEEHDWNGEPRYFEDGTGGEVTCAKCGIGYGSIIAWM